MSETIPEDILRAANALASAYIEGDEYTGETLHMLAAKALLSERKDTLERAAEVAEATGKRLAEGAIGYAIAKAIRALSKAGTD